MKTNKKKSSTARKLLPAVAMLTVSAISLSSATYAWFTMNKHVEVYGMQLRTKVGANLLICSDNVEANYSSADLIQGRMGLLEPVSSINGTTGSFYYTVNANARGQKESGANVYQYGENTYTANTVAGKVAYDDAFNATYGIKASGAAWGSSGTTAIAMDASPSGTDGAAYGYIDYVFYIKGTADAAGQKLNMTDCNLTYNDAAISSSGTAGRNLDRAWRVAVFAADIDNYGGKGYDDVKATDPAVSGNLKGILGLEGATYFSQATSGTNAQAQSTATTLADVTSFMNGDGDGVTIGTFNSAGITHYYKVLVRIWLEGEDDTCNSETYAKLQNNWKLNCKFDLQASTVNGVNGINSAAFTPASGATQEATNTNDVYKSGT